jgi:predicted DCC family thiol-disulfide oxidoreductase YuxK
MKSGAVEKPLVIFDGGCGFCRFWVDYWRLLTGSRVDYSPYQEASSQFPQLPLQALERSLHLILPDGRTYSGAEAVFHTLGFGRGYGYLVWLYENFPLFAPISELGYRLTADHRNFFDVLRRLLWGKRLVPSTYALTRWIFLRLLGITYFCAFASLWPQVTGLIGRHGIIPWGSFAQDIAGRLGPERYWLLPTLAWFNPSDGFLEFLAAGGAAFAVLIVLGILTGPALILSWIFYLSLVTVGRDFLSFQWDALLLEAGFLAIFLAPWKLLESPWRVSARLQCAPSTSAPKTVIWLLRWLLFRLFFLSGCVKLLSHDPNWRNLTALEYHYYTQPLPTPLAWYANQLPVWFQKLSVIGVFVIELFVPFLIFAPRRLRHWGGATMIAFQILIALSGNYAFFNLLAITLCLLLWDDAAWQQCFPARFVRRLEGPAEPPSRPGWRRLLYAALAIFILFLSGLEMLGDFAPPAAPQAAEFMEWIEPFHIVNLYGLFAVMTTERMEIVLQGSQDGQNWRSYSFKYKPGNPKRRPEWVAPYQPRLDWQMWFAALGSYRQNPWFIGMVGRLLEGSPDVLRLLRHNPFPGAPPRFVRAVAYDYHFTDFAARRATGSWWRRDYKGLYFPAVSLRDAP